MNQETKICQNCKQNFTLEPEDFQFYDKIKVPYPTWCPECRLLRKMVWRNERTLYKRKCDATDKNIISIYSPDKLLKVYDQKYWWSDGWDPMDYGREYDFNKSFFEQFYELYNRVPKLSLVNVNPVNSEYIHDAINNKNSYLIFFCDYNENVMYSTVAFRNQDSADCYMLQDSNNCYENFYCNKNSKVSWGFYSKECYDCQFIYNCRNCSDCIGCINLRNKKYHIFNKPYSPEEYKKKLSELNLGDYESLQNFKNEWLKFSSLFIKRFANIEKSYSVSGNNIQNSSKCINCFDIFSNIEYPRGSENSKFLFLFGWNTKESYDSFVGGYNNSLIYDSFNMAKVANIKFSSWLFDGIYDVSYSDHCFSKCSSLFGCISLRNKQYCILNKQYTKEEYEKLVPKIIEHMNNMPYIDKKGRIYKYGEFFPPELSPFAYNETIAQEYFPLTKEQAIEKGYSWKDPEQRNINIDIKSEDIPDYIKDADDSIIGQVIECQHKGECNEQCTEAFKIIQPEFKFYKKMNLPLPRLCPNCRHYQRLKQRNPLKLWYRKCQCAGEKSENRIYQNTIKHFHENQHCPNEFETTYSPDRHEIVYCEKCYQSEVV